MAIRRPPTTFSDTISTTDIADDAISGDKLANDIAISTTGNIATTGSGTLTVAGNSTLSGTNNLGSNPTVTLGSNATFPAGHVLQVKNTLMGDRLNFTPSSQTWTDIAGMSVQITPSSSSNKIMVMATVTGNSGQNVACFVRTMRDSTAVGIANTSSSRSTISAALKEVTSYDIQSVGWNFLDSPSTTSQITYKVQIYSNGGVVINTGTTSADNWSVGVTVSSITAMEIKV